MLPKRTYVRVDEVAEFIGCSERHVRRLCEQGKFHVFRIGESKSSGIRISRESVFRFLGESHRVYEEENGIPSDDSMDRADIPD